MFYKSALNKLESVLNKLDTAPSGIELTFFQSLLSPQQMNGQVGDGGHQDQHGDEGGDADDDGQLAVEVAVAVLSAVVVQLRYKSVGHVVQHLDGVVRTVASRRLQPAVAHHPNAAAFRQPHDLRVLAEDVLERVEVALGEPVSSVVALLKVLRNSREALDQLIVLGETLSIQDVVLAKTRQNANHKQSVEGQKKARHESRKHAWCLASNHWYVTFWLQTDEDL